MDWLDDYDRTTQAAVTGRETLESGMDIHDLDRLDSVNHDSVSVNLDNCNSIEISMSRSREGIG